jgi:hypothetical protein
VHDIMVISRQMCNGTAHFKKCKQLFEYRHLLLPYLQM